MAILEKEIQLAICDYLAFKKYFFWRQNTTPVWEGGENPRFRAMPKYSLKGIPDIILVKEGKFIGLEVKQPKGKQSDNQRVFQEKLEKAGGFYYIVTSLDDVVKIGF